MASDDSKATATEHSAQTNGESYRVCSSPTHAVPEVIGANGIKPEVGVTAHEESVTTGKPLLKLNSRKSPSISRKD